MKRRKKRRQQPLGDVHYRAIDLLSELHAHQGKIAKQLGISRMQLYRWRQRKDFQRELDAAIERKLAPMKREMERLRLAYTRRRLAVGDVEYIERVVRMTFDV